MKRQEPHFSHHAVPITPISPHDLQVIAEMLRTYPFYVCLTFRASAQRASYLHNIEQLANRLAATYQDHTPIPLDLEEIATIEAAMNAFELLLTAFVPKTRAILITIRASRLLRQRIALMRSRSSVGFMN